MLREDRPVLIEHERSELAASYLWPGLKSKLSHWPLPMQLTVNQLLMHFCLRLPSVSSYATRYWWYGFSGMLSHSIGFMIFPYVRLSPWLIDERYWELLPGQLVPPRSSMALWAQQQWLWYTRVLFIDNLELGNKPLTYLLITTLANRKTKASSPLSMKFGQPRGTGMLSLECRLISLIKIGTIDQSTSHWNWWLGTR